MSIGSNEVTDLLEYAGSQMEGKTEYWEAIFDRQSDCSIMKDNVDEKISMPEFAGIKLRSFNNGGWKAASSYKIEKSKLKELAIHVVKPGWGNRGNVKLKPLKPSKLDVAMPVKEKPTDIGLESKVEDMRSFHGAALNLDKRIINVRTGYRDSCIERIFVNSEGSSMRQVVTRTRLVMMPIAREGSRIRMDFVSMGGTKGYEVLQKCDFEKVARKVVDSAVELLGAKTPPSGEFPVIVDHYMGGTIAHESFGHGLEADQVVRERSYLAGLIDKQLSILQKCLADMAPTFLMMREFLLKRTYLSEMEF
jgi:TldD protein